MPAERVRVPIWPLKKLCPKRILMLKRALWVNEVEAYKSHSLPQERHVRTHGIA